MLALIFAAVVQSSVPAPPLETIGKPVADPCSSTVGRIGFDPAWWNDALIRNGHSRALVCAPERNSVEAMSEYYSMMSPDELRAAQAMNLQKSDYALQAVGRSQVQIVRDLDGRGDAPWTASDEREAARRSRIFAEEYQ